MQRIWIIALTLDSYVQLSTLVLPRRYCRLATVGAYSLSNCNSIVRLGSATAMTPPLGKGDIAAPGALPLFFVCSNQTPPRRRQRRQHPVLQRRSVTLLSEQSQPERAQRARSRPTRSAIARATPASDQRLQASAIASGVRAPGRVQRTAHPCTTLRNIIVMITMVYRVYTASILRCQEALYI